MNEFPRCPYVIEKMELFFKIMKVFLGDSAANFFSDALRHFLKYLYFVLSVNLQQNQFRCAQA